MKEFMCPDGTMSVNQICRMFMSKADRDRLAGIVPKPDKSLVTGTKNIIEIIERAAGNDIQNIPMPKKSFDEKYESIEDIPISQGTRPITDLFTGAPKTDTSLKSPGSTSSKSPGIIDTKNLVDQYKAKEISSSPIDRVIDTVNKTVSPMVDKVTQPVKDMVSKVPKGFDFDFEQVTEFKETAQSVIDKNVNFYDNVLADKFGIDADRSKQFRALSVIGGVATKGSLASVVGPFAIPFIAGGIMRDKETQRIQNITAQDPQGAIQSYPTATMNIQPTPQDIYRGGGGGGGGTSIGPTAQAGGFASDGGPVSNQTGRGRVGF